MANPEMQAQPGQMLARAGKVTQVTGALVSLALVAGVGVWGYRLLVRDMTGIPVVRAMDGPVREAPSNPGGDIVPHLGLSVNDVAAAGEAAAPEDRLLLAPVQPEFSEEDMLAMPTAEADEPLAADILGALAAPADVEIPVAALVASPAPVADPSLLVQPVAAQDTVPEVANLPEEAAPTVPIGGDDQVLTAAQVLALADQIAAGATPLTELAAGPDVPAVVTLDSATLPQIIDAAIPGVATALIPPSRPGSLAPANAGAIADAVASAAPTLTTDIPQGTNLVQLGAYETPEIASEEWDKLSVRFAEFMSGKEPVIQQATSGGRVFYRLRAMGYADLGDARRFCAALAAEEAACIPVVVR